MMKLLVKVWAIGVVTIFAVACIIMLGYYVFTGVVMGFHWVAANMPDAQKYGDAVLDIIVIGVLFPLLAGCLAISCLDW